MLSFDLRNKHKMARAWPTISNEEILSVNQQWHGHPGRLVSTWNVNTPAPTPPHPTRQPCGPESTRCSLVAAEKPGGIARTFTWVAPPVGATGGMLQHTASGLCVIGGEGRQQQLVLGKCAMVATQQWVHEASGALHLASTDKTMCMAVRNFIGPQVVMWPCNGGVNALFRLNATDHSLCTTMRNSTALCLVAQTVERWTTNSTRAATTQAAPACLDRQGDTAVCQSAFSLWEKPQSKGRHAVFVLSNQPAAAANTSVNITFATISSDLASGKVAVRDLYVHKNLGEHEHFYTTVPIGGHDSLFLMLSPVSRE